MAMGQQHQAPAFPNNTMGEYVEEEVEPVKGIVQPPYKPPENKPHRNTTQLQYILKILNRNIWKHQYAWPFLTPVDTVKLNLPDYFKIIKRPMDLGTIKKRLENFWYFSSAECVEDVRLLFNNCYTYNKDGDVVFMAKTVEDLFNNKLSQMPKEEIEIAIPVKGGKGKGKGKMKGPRGRGNVNSNASHFYFVF